MNDLLKRRELATVNLSEFDALENPNSPEIPLAVSFAYADAFGQPSGGILVRLKSSKTGETQYRAYQNLCPHWSMPLDANTGEFFDDTGHTLTCQWHGARFDPLDGECLMGPCDGEYLQKLGVEISPDGKMAVIRRTQGLRLS